MPGALIMKKEYNELTKKLLAEGYTAEHYPDHVWIADGSRVFDKENPLDNFYGGFTYRRYWAYERTFKTPCGLQCKGLLCMTDMSYMGVDWIFENDLAGIHCPYRRYGCEQKDSRLPKEGVLKDWCNVHMVDEEYQYEGSAEDILKLEEDRIQREKISFVLKRHGRVCEMHMFYNKEEGEWKMHYDPGLCARMRCNGNFGGYKVIGEPCICPILNRPLDRKKGNVFYDLKISARRGDLDGTLFEGQIDTCIQKGIRVFDHPVSMDICRNYVKLCKDEIHEHVRSKYFTQLFFAERYEGHEFSVEVLNIRAEHRVSRDLQQDLQDIRDGVRIVYDSDLQKEDKEAGKERRRKAKEERRKKMEKKILQMGYENLECIDQHRAQKLFTFEQLDELEERREENQRKIQEEPVQLSLFDMGALTDEDAV